MCTGETDALASSQKKRLHTNISIIVVVSFLYSDE